ncbi:hypothetical protein VCHENC02_2839B, partial [Vibrio harveyi]
FELGMSQLASGLRFDIHFAQATSIGSNNE